MCHVLRNLSFVGFGIWLDTYFDLLLQAYYLVVPFPIEKAPTRKITDFNGGIVISEILNYPVRGLCFVVEILLKIYISNMCILWP